MDSQKSTISFNEERKLTVNPTAVLVFLVHTSLQMINLGFWALIVFACGVVKLLFPIRAVQNYLLVFMNGVYFLFSKISVRLIKAFNNVHIEKRIHGNLSKSEWYLLISNHLSYLDIILLIEFSSEHIPAPKFFLKRELIWLPFVGIAAWALDMPFMRRYSREFIEKKPHLKGKDIETTRASCAKYKSSATTVINFVEGTRFTPEKHALKNSPFTHLLPPKAGGIAFTLASMGELFTHVLDVSLVYPDNTAHPMVEMLSGQMRKIIIDVHLLDLPEDASGDYFNDEAYRTEFQKWLNKVWTEKDERIRHLST